MSDHTDATHAQQGRDGTHAVRIPPSTETHQPTGDPKHVAYSQDYYWQCECGASSFFLMRRAKAEHCAQRHSLVCDYTPTLKVTP